MISDPKLAHWCETSTWTILEAAYLVNEFDPMDPNVDVAPGSEHPVSQTYYWLNKEEGQGRLFAASHKNGELSYSPGTLMRHLKKKKKGVSKRVFDTYELKSKHAGPHNQSKDAKAKYLQAAKLAWKIYPNLTRAEMAEALTGLPAHMPPHTLANRASSTIAKYIKGFSPISPGRPKMDSVANTGAVDLAKIAEQMSPQSPSVPIENKVIK